ncbi:hypothetical protein CR513_09787, partial [Mucuna pruriens]
MVLKRVLPNLKDSRGKWAPNYEGPYVVKQTFSGGALILTNVEGQDLKYSVNADSHFNLAHGLRRPGIDVYGTKRKWQREPNDTLISEDRVAPNSWETEWYPGVERLSVSP